MEIELLTKKDLAELTDRMIILQQQMEKIQSILNENRQGNLLSASDICRKLHISYSTFQKNKPELIKFGLFNDGRWRMKESDFLRFIETRKIKK